MEEDIAEIIGNVVGDGSLVKMNDGKIRFQLRGHLLEDKDHYDNFIVPTFNQKIAMPLTGRNVGILKYTKRNSYGIGSESKSIAKFLRDLGISLGTKRELSIPDWIKSDKKLSIAFLRGLMDTDGSVYFNKRYTEINPKFQKVIRIELGSTSGRLIQDVYTLMRSLGFKTELIKPYEKKKVNERTLFRIRIGNKRDIAKWISEIGFRNPKHSTKVELWKIYGFCPPKTTLSERRQILAGKLEIHSFYKEPDNTP